MQDSGWVKLYRKSRENLFIRDLTAWGIFAWLLIAVDRDGKLKTGRIWVAKELGIKPTTFYQALKRLEKKYKVLTQVSNNRFTEITLLNWAKYQSKEIPLTQGNENQVKTNRKPIDTLQEYKNKEYKNEEEEKEKIPNKLNLTRSQYLIFLKEFPGLTTTELKEQITKCNVYMAMSSQNYKNAGLFFRGWLRNYMADKKISMEKELIKSPIDNLPEISDEERIRNLAKLSEMRSTLSKSILKHD